MDDSAAAGSLLGDGARFSGKLTFLGSVRIEGEFDGEIRSDDTLVVAANGVVRGTVEVGVLVVAGGRVEATVTAAQSVELLPGGTLVGDVVTPQLLIEKGAVFRGTSHMPDDVGATGGDHG